MKHFFRHSIIYTVSTFLVRGISFILLPILAKCLSPSDYGAIDLINITGMFVLVFLGLESYQGIARHIVEYTDEAGKKKLVSSVIIFLFFGYSIFLVVANCFHRQILHFTTYAYSRKLLNIIIISYFLQAIIVNLQATLRYDLQIHKNVIASVMTALSILTMNVIFIVKLHLGLVGAVYGLAVGNTAGTVITVFFARKYLGINIDRVLLKGILCFTCPLAISAIFSIIMLYVDRIMLNKLLGLSYVGLFGVGYRIASIISLIMVGVQGALGPLIYSNVEKVDTKKELALLFERFTVVAIIAVVSICFFSTDILHLATNKNYYQASGVIKFLVFAVLLSNLYIFFPGMNIKKDTAIIMYLNIFGAVLNLILNYILIRLLGFNGSALASVLSYAVFLLCFAYFSQKRYYLPLNYRSIFKNLLLVFIGISISNFFSSVNLYMFMTKVIILIIFIVVMYLGNNNLVHKALYHAKVTR